MPTIVRSNLVRVITHAAVLVIVTITSTNLSAQQTKTNNTQSQTALTIVGLYPDATSASKPFNTQADGTAAIAVACKGATKTTVIVFAGEKLMTVYGGPTFLTGKVPSRLYSKPGEYEVFLQSQSQKSSIAKFKVR